jgi:hypothetical protein
MESNRLLRWMWIALLLDMELNLSTEGARLRKPTPISTSWQRQVFGSRLFEDFGYYMPFVTQIKKFLLRLLLQDRHANQKRVNKLDILLVLQTVD